MHFLIETKIKNSILSAVKKDAKPNDDETYSDMLGHGNKHVPDTGHQICLSLEERDVSGSIAGELDIKIGEHPCKRTYKTRWQSQTH